MVSAWILGFALLGYLALEESSRLMGPILALSAASFLYIIGLADLIPELFIDGSVPKPVSRNFRFC